MASSVKIQKIKIYTICFDKKAQKEKMEISKVSIFFVGFCIGPMKIKSFQISLLI